MLCFVGLMRVLSEVKSRAILAHGAGAGGLSEGGRARLQLAGQRRGGRRGGRAGGMP